MTSTAWTSASSVLPLVAVSRSTPRVSRRRSEVGPRSLGPRLDQQCDRAVVNKISGREAPKGHRTAKAVLTRDWLRDEKKPRKRKKDVVERSSSCAHGKFSWRAMTSCGMESTSMQHQRGTRRRRMLMVVAE